MISASGLGPNASFSSDVLADAARVLLPRRPIPGSTPLPRQEAARMGGRMGGEVQGRASGAEWIAVALHSEAGLLDAVEPLVAARRGEGMSFADEKALRDFWATEKTRGLRAISLIGTHPSWLLQEELQLDGALVGRLPFEDANALNDYARATVRRETLEKAPRVATIFAAGVDEFTTHLHDTFVKPLVAVLAKLGFHTTVCSDSDVHEAEISESRFIVLLTHGADGPTAGEPVGLPPRAREAILAACRYGAFVLHLGCNGAGTFGGGRFGSLATELRLELPRASPSDAVSPFAAQCLTAGCGGILAHVDSTWSNAFVDARVIATWLDWVASGKGALAFAAEDISREAGKAAVDAVLKQGAGDTEASLSWLRFVDLRGFVILGDPSSFGRWL